MGNRTKYVAKTLQGMESLAADELRELGAADVQEKRRAVYFYGDKKMLYKANVCCRFAVSILKPLFWFRAHKESVMYKQISKFDWLSVLDVEQTFAINSSVHSPFFNHSKYVSLKAKDAIVDQFRHHLGKRPNVDPINPDVKINIHVNEADFDISLDSSGDGLHKRGYRTPGHLAPLNEVLAAGMVKLSGWTPEKPFVDPMCGSGTLSMEACMISTNTAPGLLRENFGFMNWNDFEPQVFKEVISEAKQEIKSPPSSFLLSDKDYKSVELAKNSAEELGFSNYMNFENKRFQELTQPHEGGVVILNPPYGERLSKLDVMGLYKSIGDSLKENFNGFDAWILSSNMDAFKNVGLRPSRKIPLMNGALQCKFMKYEMYRGSKKAKYQNPE